MLEDSPLISTFYHSFLPYQLSELLCEWRGDVSGHLFPGVAHERRAPHQHGGDQRAHLPDLADVDTGRSHGDAGEQSAGLGALAIKMFAISGWW